MSFPVAKLSALALLSTLCHSYVFDANLAQATATGSPSIPGLDSFEEGLRVRNVGMVERAPVVTPAPKIPSWFLRKRQTDDDSNQNVIGYVAPDNTCGFISGSIGAALTCNSDQQCGALNAPNSAGQLLCCSVSKAECTALGNCVNSADLSSSCNNACQQDINTLKCSLSGFPICASYTMPDVDAYWYSCDTASPSAPIEVATTYSGATKNISWSAVSSDQTTEKLSTSKITDKTASNPLSGPTGSNKPKSGGDDGGSSTPIGAIVGGVIGGLALIIIGIALLWFLFLRHRKQNKELKKDASPPVDGAYGAHDAKNMPPSNMTSPQQGTLTPNMGYANAPPAGYPQSPNSEIRNSYYGDPKMASPGGTTYAPTTPGTETYNSTAPPGANTYATHNGPPPSELYSEPPSELPDTSTQRH